MIHLRYFASLRDTLGKDREDIDWLAEFQTVADVKSYLKTTDTQWHTLFSEQTLLCALNQQMVTDDAPINDGDELAFFPPVTGG